MKINMLLVSALTLAGCDKASVTADRSYDERVENGEVALAAIAPDGTKLWAVSPPGSGRRVYFSSAGTDTTHAEPCGKGCVRTVTDQVPNAKEPQP